ncbi:hypothetical protein ACLK1T_14705 [Escherichia coli]
MFSTQSNRTAGADAKILRIRVTPTLPGTVAGKGKTLAKLFINNFDKYTDTTG